jgi:hypothetical protein
MLLDLFQENSGVSISDHTEAARRVLQIAPVQEPTAEKRQVNRLPLALLDQSHQLHDRVGIGRDFRLA